jgi:hypothetical protein
LEAAQWPRLGLHHTTFRANKGRRSYYPKSAVTR